MKYACQRVDGSWCGMLHDYTSDKRSLCMAAFIHTVTDDAIGPKPWTTHLHKPKISRSSNMKKWIVSCKFDGALEETKIPFDNETDALNCLRTLAQSKWVESCSMLGPYGHTTIF